MRPCYKKKKKLAQVVECLFSLHEALGFDPSPALVWWHVPAFPTLERQEQEDQIVENQSWLHRKLEASLGYMSTCFKKSEQNKTGEKVLVFSIFFSEPV